MKMKATVFGRKVVEKRFLAPISENRNPVMRIGLSHKNSLMTSAVTETNITFCQANYELSARLMHAVNTPIEHVRQKKVLVSGVNRVLSTTKF